MFLQLAHTRLDIFRISKELVLVCYKVTSSFPFDERFSLVQQIRRACISIHLNIAEGSSRRSPAERKRFYEIARGSLVEVDTALDIALHLNYTTTEKLEELASLISRNFQMVSKMIEKSHAG